MGQATTWTEIAAVRSALGDPPGVIKAVNNSWLLATRALGEHHPLLVDPLVKAVNLLVLHGRHEEALPHLARALALKRAHTTEPDVELATVLHTLGMANNGLGRHDEALEHHRTAVQIVEARLGPEHSQLIAMLTNYATAALDAGRPELARSLLHRALPVLRTKFGPEHDHTARAERLLAEAETRLPTK
jgi:tetratricopeptide (TPR) repeat protein